MNKAASIILCIFFLGYMLVGCTNTETVRYNEGTTSIKQEENIVCLIKDVYDTNPMLDAKNDSDYSNYTVIKKKVNFAEKKTLNSIISGNYFYNLIYFMKDGYNFFALEKATYGDGKWDIVLENLYFKSELPSKNVLKNIKTGMVDKELEKLIPGNIVFTEYPMYYQEKEKLEKFEPMSRLILDDGTIVNIYFKEQEGNFVVNRIETNCTEYSTELVKYVKEALGNS